VDAKQTIGIYITANSATVSAASAGKDLQVAACFTVNIDTNLLESPDAAEKMTELIAQECSKRSIVLQDGSVAVALDSSMFMQHRVHSEFTDTKQIAQTVRFDTEEAVATDISELALAFHVASPAQGGSNLSVFTVGRKLLTGILSAFDKKNIDPVYIEPDIVCLSRFIAHNFAASAAGGPQADSTQPSPHAGSAGSSHSKLFAVLSSSNGYLIVPPAAGRQSSVLRTFMVGSAQDRFALLRNQIMVTTAMLPQDEKLNSLAVFDSSGSIAAGRLAEALGVKSENIDLAARMAGDNAEAAIDKVSLAIATGAAIAFDDKNRVDFRVDFSPYKGKQIRLEKNLKIISVCAVICLLALGILAQISLYNVNKPRKIKREEFNNNYRLVLPASKDVSGSLKVAIKDLEGELRRLQKLKQGLGDNGQKSVPDKLALLLRAFNASAEPAKLEIQSIDITVKTIRITGSTNGAGGTGSLREAIVQNNLKIDQEDLSYKGDRHNFSMTLSAK
jgi:hypothetical protein